MLDRLCMGQSEPQLVLWMCLPCWEPWEWDSFIPFLGGLYSWGHRPIGWKELCGNAINLVCGEWVGPCQILYDTIFRGRNTISVNQLFEAPRAPGFWFSHAPFSFLFNHWIGRRETAFLPLLLFDAWWAPTKFPLNSSSHFNMIPGSCLVAPGFQVCWKNMKTDWKKVRPLPCRPLPATRDKFDHA